MSGRCICTFSEHDFLSKMFQVLDVQNEFGDECQTEVFSRKSLSPALLSVLTLKLDVLDCLGISRHTYYISALFFGSMSGNEALGARLLQLISSSNAKSNDPEARLFRDESVSLSSLQAMSQ